MLGASGALACEIRLLEHRSGAWLQSIALGSARHIDLTYLHSVTKTPVRETLALDAHGFTQQRIEFFEQGPGLPTEALAGERFVRLADRFVYDNMQRPLALLVMRVDPAQRQTLETGAAAFSLTRWGAKALQLQAHECD